MAKHDIRKGEVLSFDYTLTEVEIAEPFDCSCGSDICKGKVGKFWSNLKKLKIEIISSNNFK